MATIDGMCADCGEHPCRNPKRPLDDCCACSGEVCGDCACPAIELVTCEVCCVGDREDELLLCDGCDHACHLACMRPPRSVIPALWFCQRCVAAAMDKRRRLGSSNATAATVNAAGARVHEGWNPRARAGVPENLGRGERTISGETQPMQRAGRPLADVDEELVRRLDLQKLKTCNCRKSRCLKQYCECFREKEFCSHRCNCLSCHNLPGKPPLTLNPHRPHPIFLPPPAVLAT